MSTAAIEERVDDLLARMTLEEKVGLMFHPPIFMNPDGTLLETSTEERDRRPAPQPLQHLRRAGPRQHAEWHNRLQELAETTRLGIPVTISSDPRHSFAENFGACVVGQARSRNGPSRSASARSATRSRRGVRRHRAARVPRRRHPRRAASDGGPRHRAAVGADHAHLRRGRRARRASGRRVHPRFPGRRARAAVGRLHDEALPRRRPAARRRGPALPLRQGSGLPRRHVRVPPARLRSGLRGRNGADHAVLRTAGRHAARGGRLRLQPRRRSPACCASATASTASSAPTGGSSPTSRCPTARCSRRSAGASRSSSAEERLVKIVDAGCDQLGGEELPELLVELVHAGRIAEERVDESARRLLRDKFRLGLFDDPYVDPDEAERTCGSPPVRAKGERAQRRSAVADLERRRAAAEGGRARLRRRPRLRGRRGEPRRSGRRDRAAQHAVRAAHERHSSSRSSTPATSTSRSPSYPSCSSSRVRCRRCSSSTSSGRP